MYNKLVSTYESASTRRFRFGRVDNIRANTPEALEWAQAMVDETGNVSASEKLRLFRRAMQAQTDLMIQVGLVTHAQLCFVRQDHGAGIGFDL
jgi:choline O-acetyltransferase